MDSRSVAAYYLSGHEFIRWRIKRSALNKTQKKCHLTSISCHRTCFYFSLGLWSLDIYLNNVFGNAIRLII